MHQGTTFDVGGWAKRSTLLRRGALTAAVAIVVGVVLVSVAPWDRGRPPPEGRFSGPPAVAATSVVVSGVVVERFGGHVIEITGGRNEALIVVVEEQTSAAPGDRIRAEGTVARLDQRSARTAGVSLRGRLRAFEGRPALFAPVVTSESAGGPRRTDGPIRLS